MSTVDPGIRNVAPAHSFTSFSASFRARMDTLVSRMTWLIAFTWVCLRESGQ